MQIIAVDIGNSAIKLLVGEDHLRLPYQSDALPSNFTDALEKHLPQIDASEAVFWAVASVNDSLSQRLADWVKQNRSNDRFEIIARNQVPLDIVDSYRKTVGIDRLVAAYAAVSLTESTVPLIIVDAGTAVTIDVVSGPSDAGRQFEGGVIFPGAGPSLYVLNSSTADLPDVPLSAARMEESNSIDGIIGTQTDMAIANGVCLSQAHAVAGIVAVLESRLAGASVWITGGGAESIFELLGDEVAYHWNAEPQLVLHGATLVGKQILSNDKAD